MAVEGLATPARSLAHVRCLPCANASRSLMKPASARPAECLDITESRVCVTPYRERHWPDSVPPVGRPVRQQQSQRYMTFNRRLLRPGGGLHPITQLQPLPATINVKITELSTTELLATVQSGCGLTLT